MRFALRTEYISSIQGKGTALWKSLTKVVSAKFLFLVIFSLEMRHYCNPNNEDCTVSATSPLPLHWVLVQAVFDLCGSGLH